MSLEKNSIEQHSRTVIRGTSVTGLWTLASRMLGFIRDLLVARLFGATAVADCFYVAFRIPNLLRSFVAEGALSSAFVPVFTAELAHGRERAQRTVSQVLGFLLIVCGILAIGGIAFAPQIVHLLAPGFGRGTEREALCIALTRVMLPYIIFVSLVAMLNAALNSMKIFGAAAFAQVLMNFTLIAGALAAMPFIDTVAVYVLAFSVILGGAVQVAAQMPALRREGLSLRPTLAIFTPQVKQIVLLMLPAVIGATVYQLSQFITTLLASLLETGSVSWLFYADRLTQLPVGIFSIALASVLLPSLARASHESDQTGFSQMLVNSLRYTSFIILPIAALIFFFADPLIALMFERGAFTAYDTAMTALAVQGLALGIWSMSCHSMIARAFIAKRDTVTPTLVGLLGLGFSATFALCAMGTPRQPGAGRLYQTIEYARQLAQQYLFAADLRHAGLALSSAVAASVALICLIVLLAFRERMIVWGPFIRATWQSLISSAAMLTLLSITLEYWRPTSPALELLLMLPAGFLYLGFMRALGSRECRETFAALANISSKSGGRERGSASGNPATKTSSPRDTGVKEVEDEDDDPLRSTAEIIYAWQAKQARPPLRMIVLGTITGVILAILFFFLWQALQRI